MTLIVGIKCSDGVVIGADGAATLGNIAQTTIQQPVKKLALIDNEMILGVSGPVAFSQIYAAEIQRLSTAQVFKKTPEKALTAIRDAVWARTEKEWNAASVVAKSIGQSAMQAVMSNAVVAMTILGQPALFQFNHQCTPEEATADLPFVSIGSGQKLADPFLAFLRRIFWPSKLPMLSEGIFATLWSLEQAILTNTGGVSKPIQIMALSRDKLTKKWSACELSEDELEEHRQNIAGAEQALANYGKDQGTQPAPEVPIPDPPG